MKSQFILAGALVTSSAVFANLAQAEPVNYRGEVSATNICRSIVENNPKRLQAQLGKAASTQTTLLAAKRVQDEFSCNGKSLQDFAAKVGARDALAFLEGRPVEQAVASN